MTTEVSWFANWTKTGQTGHLPKDVECLRNAPNASRDRVAIFPANPVKPATKGDIVGTMGTFLNWAIYGPSGPLIGS